MSYVLSCFFFFFYPSRGVKPPKRQPSYADTYGIESDPFSDLFADNTAADLKM